MKCNTRVRWWDGRSGSDVIGDFTAQGWQFFEKPYGEIRWFDLSASAELIKKAEAVG